MNEKNFISGNLEDNQFNFVKMSLNMKQWIETWKFYHQLISKPFTKL
jgi:hypothetical protein